MWTLPSQITYRLVYYVAVNEDKVCQWYHIIHMFTTHNERVTSTFGQWWKKQQNYSVKILK